MELDDFSLLAIKFTWTFQPHVTHHLGGATASLLRIAACGWSQHITTIGDMQRPPKTYTIIMAEHILCARTPIQANHPFKSSMHCWDSKLPKVQGILSFNRSLHLYALIFCLNMSHSALWVEPHSYSWYVLVIVFLRLGLFSRNFPGPHIYLPALHSKHLRLCTSHVVTEVSRYLSILFSLAALLLVHCLVYDLLYWHCSSMMDIYLIVYVHH